MSQPSSLFALSTLVQAYGQRLAMGDQPAESTVAYLGAAAPLELIVAAGLVPRRLFPNPQAATPLADRYMEPVFDGAIRSLFDRLLQRNTPAWTMLLIPRHAEGYLQLYYFLQEAQRWETGLTLPGLHLFDLLKTPHRSTRLYARAQLQGLQAALEALVGRRIAAPALADAIGLLNQQRRLMALVGALRREPAARLSGTAFLQVAGAAGVLSPAQHITLLQKLLDDAASLPVHSGVRVMVKGSAPDDLRLYRLIEDCGGLVVCDDHANGETAWEGLVAEDIDPLDALARKAHRDTPTLRSLPQAEQDQRFVQRALAAGVRGVVFYFEEHDDTLGWDHPKQQRLLQAQGIASLCLQHQPYRAVDTDTGTGADTHPQRAMLQAWLQSLAADQTQEARA